MEIGVGVRRSHKISGPASTHRQNVLQQSGAGNGLKVPRRGAGVRDFDTADAAWTDYWGRNEAQVLHGRAVAGRAGFHLGRLLNGRDRGWLIIEALLQGGEFGFSVPGGQDAVVADFLETRRQAVL